MNLRSMLFGGVIGLLLGGLGSVLVWREWQHTRIRLADFEAKEAKMKAHLQRRSEIDDEHLTARANQSSRRLSDA